MKKLDFKKDYLELQEQKLDFTQFEKYRNHPLVVSLNLTNKEFEENLSKIVLMVDEQEECNKLMDKCSNPTNHHTCLEKKDGRIISYSIYCPKMDKLNKQESFKKNYLYRTFSDNLLELSIQKKYFNNQFPNSKKQLIKKILNLNKVDSFEHGFYIYGSSGVGKTYLTTAFANDLTRKNKKVAYCYIPDLIFEIKTGFDNTQKGLNSKIIEKLIKADVLFLDDLVTDASNFWFYNNFLLIVLNKRMEEKKPTFFTCNISLDEFQKKIGYKNQSESLKLCERIRALVNNEVYKIEDENYRYPKNSK